MHEHFLQDNHHGFLNDAQVTLIDKTQASDSTKRESNLAWKPLKHIIEFEYWGDILVVVTK